MKQPYDWSKPINTQNPLSVTRSSLRNQQKMGTVDKELYNQLVAKFNALNTEHSTLVEQQLQQAISSQTLSSIQTINNSLTDNAETIKHLQAAITTLNDKITKPSIKPN